MLENFVLPKFVNPNLAQTSWGQAELGSSTWNQRYHGWNHLSRGQNRLKIHLNEIISDTDKNSSASASFRHWDLSGRNIKTCDARSPSQREKHMIVQVQEWKGQWEIEEWKDDRWRVWLPQCSLGLSPCQQTLRCHCWKVWSWQLVHTLSNDQAWWGFDNCHRGLCPKLSHLVSNDRTTK